MAQECDQYSGTSYTYTPHVGLTHGDSIGTLCIPYSTDVTILTMQLELVRRLPFCYATLLGTHNSAITLADGYGNRDEYFQQYFKWIRWVVCSRPSTTFLNIVVNVLVSHG